MSRWFEIKGNCYKLDSFTHFEATVDYNQEHYIIKGYHPFPVTWSDDRDPNIRTQSYVVIGDIDNKFESKEAATEVIMEILRGDYDVDTLPTVVEIVSESKLT